MRKKIIKSIVIGAIISTSLFFNGCSNNKNNVVEFEAKFIACMEVETDILYDNINGLLTEKEYVDEMRKSYSNYASIKKEAFNEVDEEYKEYLKVLEYNTNNYATITKEDKDKENKLASSIIEVFNEVNKEKNIDIEERNEKIKDYIIEFRENMGE